MAIVILGGGHDLADEIKALNPRAVFQRIELEAWRRAMIDLRSRRDIGLPDLR